MGRSKIGKIKIENGFNIKWFIIRLSIPVSSAVERPAFNRMVVGSIPTPGVPPNSP